VIAVTNPARLWSRLLTEKAMLTLHELFQLFVQGRADEHVWKIEGDLDTAFDALMLSLNAQMDAQQVLSFAV
jgi:hypothetical protein